MEAKMKVTENEVDLLVAIRDSEYNDNDTCLNPVWLNCVWGFSGSKRFSGTSSSLVKKGLIVTDTDTCWLTPEGLQIANEMHPKETRPLDKVKALKAKAAMAAKSAKIKTETKTSEDLATAGNAAWDAWSAKRDTKPVAETKLNLVTMEATGWQQIAIECAVEAMITHTNRLDADSAKYLLRLLQDSVRIQFVMKA
jgi:hypothetical protein